jgi:hypothetical protein
MKLLLFVFTGIAALFSTLPKNTDISKNELSKTKAMMRSLTKNKIDLKEVHYLAGANGTQDCSHGSKV